MDTYNTVNQFDIKNNFDLLLCWAKENKPTDYADFKKNLESADNEEIEQQIRDNLSNNLMNDFLNNFIGIFSSLNSFAALKNAELKSVHQDTNEPCHLEFWHNHLSQHFTYYHASEPHYNVYSKDLVINGYSPVVFIFSK